MTRLIWKPVNPVNHISSWWSQRSDIEKWVLGVAGVVCVILVVCGVTYAIVSGGIVIASGGTVVAVGTAATTMASALA